MSLSHFWHCVNHRILGINWAKQSPVFTKKPPHEPLAPPGTSQWIKWLYEFEFLCCFCDFINVDFPCQNHALKHRDTENMMACSADMQVDKNTITVTMWRLVTIRNSQQVFTYKTFYGSTKSGYAWKKRNPTPPNIHDYGHNMPLTRNKTDSQLV